MSCTFPVDDVTPAAEPLPTRPLRERLKGALALGGDPELPTIDLGGVHPLLLAVHQAFSDHRPLALSPDAIWLTIAQGVAQHIAIHAEELRPRLVRHEGRKDLAFQAIRPFSGPEIWALWLADLRGLLAAEVAPRWGRFFACDFTTSTWVEEAAAHVVMLDAFSPYFRYFLAGICGIPEITLAGSAEDWRRIRARVETLPELGLAQWAESLRWILDGFVDAAEGRIDRTFWQEIYKPRQLYGPERITGWIGRLFPYIRGEGRMDVPNPMLALSHAEVLRLGAEAADPFAAIPSLTPDDVPGSPSSIAIELIFPDGSRRGVKVVGGLVAVEQEPGGRLSPRAGFAVREDPGGVADALYAARRIQARHEWTAPEPGPVDQKDPFSAFHGEISEARLSLRGGTWRVRPPREQRRVALQREGTFPLSLSPRMDLPDGRVLASVGPRSFLIPAALAGIDAESQAREGAIRERYESGLITEQERDWMLLDIAWTHPSSPGDIVEVRGSFFEILARLLAGEDLEIVG